MTQLNHCVSQLDPRCLTFSFCLFFLGYVYLFKKYEISYFNYSLQRLYLIKYKWHFQNQNSWDLGIFTKYFYLVDKVVLHIKIPTMIKKNA